jgi:nicotinic acid mononucleotide adenylyltransferase
MVRFLMILTVTFGLLSVVLLPSNSRQAEADAKIAALEARMRDMRDLLFQSATLSRVNARVIDNCTLQHTVDDGFKAIQDHLYPDDPILISGPDNLDTVRR